MPIDHLHHTLQEAQKNLGDPPLPLPLGYREVIERKNTLEREPEKGKTEQMTFAKTMHYQALHYQHRLFTLQAKQSLNEPVEKADFEASALAKTYFEYMPQVTAQYCDAWQRYLTLSRDPTLPPLSAGIQKREEALHKSFIEFNELVRQRNDLHQCSLLRKRISFMEKDGSPRGKVKEGELRKQCALIASRLPAEMKEAVEQKNDDDASREIGKNAGKVERQIHTIVKGVDGESPLALYADAMKEVYGIVAQRERDIAGSVRMPHASKAKVLREIYVQRMALANEMVRAIGDYGQYEIRIARLTAIQNMFDIPEVGYLTQIDDIKKVSPEKLLAAKNHLLNFANSSTNEALQSIEEHVKYVGKNTLHIGPAHELEHLWDKGGRDAVNWVLAKVTNIVTFPLALVPSARRAQQQRIMGPLYEAMGFPSGQTDFDALTPEQQKVVLDRATSMKDIILRFDRSAIDRVDQNAKLLRKFQDDYPASQRFGERTQDLAALRAKYPLITEQNLPELMKDAKNNIATIYSLLYEQLNYQYGTPEQPGSYMGQLAQLTKDIQENMKTHIDFASAYMNVGRELNPVSASNINWYLWGGVAAAGGYAGKTIGKYALMPKGSSALAGAGAVFYGNELYEDFKEFKSINDFSETIKANVELEIKNMQRELNGLVEKGIFKKVGDRKYVHVESGISAEIPDEATVTGSLNSELIRCYVKAGKNSALAMSLFARALRLKGVTGFVGLAITGVEIGYDEVNDAWKKANALSFMRDAPAWLVAKFGTTELTKFSEHDLLAHASAARLSGAFHSLDQDQKEEVRRKLCYAIFSQGMKELAGELWEVTGEQRTVAEMQVFFDGDFKKIVLPYALVSLHREIGDSWEKVSRGQIDDGWVVFPPNVTFVQMRRAMHEASAFYLQHVREKRYIAAQQSVSALENEVQKLERTNSPEGALTGKRSELADMRFAVRVLGGDQVFGKRVGDDVTPDVITANDGKTRAELAGAFLSEHAGDASGIASIRGMPSSVKFANRSEVIGYVDDPVVRAKMTQVVPYSTDERESRLYPKWNEWSEQFANLDPSKDRDEKALATKLDVDAINFIRAEIRTALPEMRPDEQKFWADVPEQVGEQRAGLILTQSVEKLIAVFLAGKTTRDDLLAGETLNPNGRSTHDIPLVFASLQAPSDEKTEELRQLCRMPIPNGFVEPAFSVENARAVIYEGMYTKGGIPVILCTALYGDLESGRPDRIFVLQTSNCRTKTKIHNNRISGQSIPSRGVDYFRNPRSLKMLDAVRKSLVKKREDDELKSFETQFLTEKMHHETQSKQEQILVNLPTDRFVELSKYEYRSKISLPDGTEHIASLSMGKSSVSPLEKPLGRYEGLPLKFSTEGRNGKTKYSIDGTFMQSPDLTQVDKDIVRKVLTFPIDGDDDLSLQKILGIFPHAVSRSIFRRSWDRYYKKELIDELLPILSRVPNAKMKEFFLRRLLEMLEESQEVTKQSRISIAEWFKQHKADFGVE